MLYKFSILCRENNFLLIKNMIHNFNSKIMTQKKATIINFHYNYSRKHSKHDMFYSLKRKSQSYKTGVPNFHLLI